MNEKLEKSSWKTLILLYIGLIKCNIIRGASMEPLLYSGDTVFSKKTHTFSVDDIVIAQHPFRNNEIIKQITQIDEDTIKLLGMNENESEDSRTFGNISKKNVLRVVIAKKRTQITKEPTEGVLL
ncbi:MAG: S26 family signal peptidase [Candidatus Magasanikbacteria bacterium CG_4_9_14_0_2_um_filter_41_10]|uniref:S26 family signal peptidase n=1 Tax=Candidatus Magasanikbacteria bacterium CG_4_10_14_0_2_um_filter_41_31 TaxID=1974639 RepID=A0A2M7V3Z4_9BACT|nr:MAG: S26 family signal peptidase [Candidatus Magasanikbacteria bacterium CG_4_10_14_0_2_um_filter_41_31]PJC53069.1 MAG: S26 family signal peptidase [Candidatus Magasanikbacteria bacterium CG_4_9_14_0_2_um_filter_41_10]